MEPCRPQPQPVGEHVHPRLVEKKANGAALSVLRDKISGLKPISPDGLEGGAGALDHAGGGGGNVYLPAPQRPGQRSG